MGRTTEDLWQQVSRAALRWWKAHRPVGWTTDQHLAEPTVNCVGPNEHKLATEVARMVKQNTGRANGCFLDEGVK